MGRHDLSLSLVIKGRSSLASGLYASTTVLTPTGWVAMVDLQVGDLVVTSDHGLSPIVAKRDETRAVLWSVLFPAGALENASPVLLPPGQPVLVTSAHAFPFTGEAQALVPATALEGWRGICPHVPALSEPVLQMRLARPGLIQAGPGLVLGIEGDEAGEADLIRRFFSAPERAVLPLAAARRLVAVMVAEDTGQDLRQAAFAPPENRV